MKISIIGSGNVARALAKRIFESGHEINAIFGRDYSKASELARSVQSKAVEKLAKLPEDSDVYILAVKDDAIVEVAKAIESKKGIIAHTSGATPLSIFEGIQQNFGVFYPLQTFSAEIEADFNELPICISANNIETETKQALSAWRNCNSEFDAQKIQPIPKDHYSVVLKGMNHHSPFLYEINDIMEDQNMVLN
jgi:predicted short-subunit dehydrogenase-like oxidoreductase (DUF2520 family)